MNELSQMKSLLFEEMELALRTSVTLISKIKEEHLDFRPHHNMRSLRELAEHLTAIPSVDLLILQERTQEEVRLLENEFALLDIGSLQERMKEGVKKVRDYMDHLQDSDFLNKKSTPFYLEHGSSQAKWLVEIVTHLFHHRSQLFTYMKMQGYDISMFDLY
ncbi:DinB family protein [Neobacillus mesonae]|nr:DinB family protein [Neobacillus mesonae]